MSTEPGPPDVPIWQRSFLPEDAAPPAPAPPGTAPPAPVLAAPVLPAPVLPAPVLPPPAAPAYPPPVDSSPVSALPPPTGPAYGAPGHAAAPAPQIPPLAAYPPPPPGYAPAPVPAYAAPVAAVPKRFGILPDPAYDAPPPPPPPGAAAFGAPLPPPPWGQVAAPSYETPKQVVTAGRWGRARGIIGILVNGLVLVAAMLGSASSALGGNVVIASLVMLALYVVWLYAGQQTIQGNRSAAALLRALAIADLGILALVLLFGLAVIGPGVLGAVVDIYLLTVLFGATGTQWMGSDQRAR